MRLDIKDFNKSKYELLAPAGSFEALKAAVEAGCDAVYCGGSMFGARAFANNFTTEELVEAIDYCHTYGRALYLTVNTLLKNSEIEAELYNYLKPLYEAGLDAVIVQDLGVLRFIRDNFPYLDIHASTQMTVLGKNFAKELESIGVSRVVTPRELSLSEIKNIYETTQVEIETFVHGALCYCYSGQCLMSSLIGQRSGNRGKCAQPCRLPYSYADGAEKYLLSPKDLCSIQLLPELLESGIYSLKIEGRMKNPEYVSVVTSIYRKYIDLYEKNGRNGYKVLNADVDKLLEVYNRGGFTEGFFNKQNSKDIIFTSKPNHLGVKAGTIKKISGNNIYFNSSIALNKNDVLEFRLKNKEYISFNLGSDYAAGEACTGFLYKKGVKNINDLYNTDIYRTKNAILEADCAFKKLDLNGKISIRHDKNIEFSAWYKDIRISLSFDKPSKAIKQAIDEKAVLKQLNKTGNEEFNFGNIEVELDKDIFVQLGLLNQIRREVMEAFKTELLRGFKRQSSVKKEPLDISEKANTEQEIYSALVTTAEQLKEVLKADNIKTVYIEQAFNSYHELKLMCEMVRKAFKRPILAMPHITRQVFDKELKNNLNFYLENDYEGYMFRNLETFFMFKSNGIDLKEIVFDSNIYTYNNYSYEYYRGLGAKVLTASYEHNLKELRNMPKNNLEINIYGYIPIMLSANCVNKTLSKCSVNFKKKADADFYEFKDRLGNKLKYVCNCKYCYNIIYNNVPLSAFEELLMVINYGYRRFRLNFTVENGEETSSILKYYFENISEGAPSDYTKGHLKRGV